MRRPLIERLPAPAAAVRRDGAAGALLLLLRLAAYYLMNPARESKVAAGSA